MVQQKEVDYSYNVCATIAPMALQPGHTIVALWVIGD